MKSTFTPNQLNKPQKARYPLFKQYNDLDNPSNLFNGSVMLFPNDKTMVVIHASETTQSYKQGAIYTWEDSDLFIAATDDSFHDVTGKLVFDFN